LFESGLIKTQPKITVVQAEGAAPFARFYSDREHESFVNDEHPHTLASAIKIGAPVSWQKAWRAVRETGGSVITVSEQEIADANAVIGRDGIGCEPASATTVAGIRKLEFNENESVVAVLTGHVLKDTDYVIKYHSNNLIAPDGTALAGTFANNPIRVQSVKSVVDLLR
jgi:threonine synthase